MPLRSRIERLERERGTARVPEEPSPATERLLTRLDHHRKTLDYATRLAGDREAGGAEPPEPLPEPTPEELREDLQSAKEFRLYLSGQLEITQPGTPTHEAVERAVAMNAERIEELTLEIEYERSDR